MFDPAANARMLAEIQARSLRAAGDLVDRLAQSVDGTTAAPPDPEQSAGDDAASGMTEAARLFDVWIELLQRASSTFAGRAAPPSRDEHHVEVDVAVDGASERLMFTVDTTGAQCGDSPEVWLHNGTAVSLGPIALQCGELRASDGAALTASIHFDPPVVESLPARSSRGVAVSVAAASELSEGRYRGIIQADGAPQIWLPVEVVATKVVS
jgi:hypothetical protein